MPSKPQKLRTYTICSGPQRLRPKHKLRISANPKTHCNRGNLCQPLATPVLSTQQCHYGCELGAIYNAYHEFNATFILQLEQVTTVPHITDQRSVVYLLPN